MNLLRKVRGAIGTALTWALGWTPIGAAWAAYVWLSVRDALPPGAEPSLFRVLAVVVGAWALSGAASGAVFAGVLALAERRRRLEELPVSRVALWGALGGLAVPAAVFVALRVVYGVNAVYLSALLSSAAVSLSLGAASAAGTLLLARRAPEPALAAAADDYALLPNPDPPLTTPPTVPWRREYWNA